MSLTQTDIAWAAGLFDGEGSISAHFIGPRLVLRLALSMTSKRAVDRFYEIIHEGTIHQRITPKGRRLYCWSASFQDGAAVLNTIQGDLTVKAQQAVIYHTLASEMRGKRGPRLTKEITQWRKRLVRELQNLNL